MLVYPICAMGENDDGEVAKPVGVLQVINKIGGAFDGTDEEVLAKFSAKAAAVIAANPMYYKHEEAKSSEAAALNDSLASPAKVSCFLLAACRNPSPACFSPLTASVEFSASPSP